MNRTTLRQFLDLIAIVSAAVIATTHNTAAAAVQPRLTPGCNDCGWTGTPVTPTAAVRRAKLHRAKSGHQSLTVQRG